MPLNRSDIVHMNPRELRDQPFNSWGVPVTLEEAWRSKVAYNYRGEYVHSDKWFILLHKNHVGKAIERIQKKRGPNYRTSEYEEIADEIRLMLKGADYSKIVNAQKVKAVKANRLREIRRASR